jgi:hypothetical protein
VNEKLVADMSTIKEAQEKAEQARQAAQAAAEVANLAAQEARLLQQAADSQARHAQYELRRQADWARVLPTLTQLNATVREATTGKAVNVTVPVLVKVVKVAEWSVSWHIEPTSKLEKRSYSNSVHVEFTVATKVIQVRTTIDGDKPANYRVLRGGDYNWAGISKAISERCQRVCVQTARSNERQADEAEFLSSVVAKLLASGCADVTKSASWAERPRNRYQSGTHHTASVSGRLADNVRITVTPGTVELRVICKDEERDCTIDAFVKHGLVAH